LDGFTEATRILRSAIDLFQRVDIVIKHGKRVK